jgi:hypothetical protein
VAVGSNPAEDLERDTMNDRVKIYEPPIGISIYRAIEEAVRLAPARFEVNNTTFETCKGEPFEEALERYQKEFNVEVVSDEVWRQRRLDLMEERRRTRTEEYCIKCEKKVEVRIENTSDLIKWVCPECHTTLDTMAKEHEDLLSILPKTKNCILCGEEFSCGAHTGSCWCNDFPQTIPVPNDNAGCYCPKCLRLQIEETTK